MAVGILPGIFLAEKLSMPDSAVFAGLRQHVLKHYIAKNKELSGAMTPRF